MTNPVQPEPAGLRYSYPELLAYVHPSLASTVDRYLWAHMCRTLWRPVATPLQLNVLTNGSPRETLTK